MGSTYEKNRQVKMAFLLVLLALVLIEPFAMASVVPLPLQTWHVHVVNGLKNATLLVHCKSKDDDLGSQNLAMKAEFQWTFKINIWLTTLYWCFLQKPNADVSFDAFWVEREHLWLNYRCIDRNCIWTAKDDGIYLRNNPDGVDELVHKWGDKLV